MSLYGKNNKERICKNSIFLNVEYSILKFKGNVELYEEKGNEFKYYIQDGRLWKLLKPINKLLEEYLKMDVSGKLEKIEQLISFYESYDNINQIEECKQYLIKIDEDSLNTNLTSLKNKYLELKCKGNEIKNKIEMKLLVLNSSLSSYNLECEWDLDIDSYTINICNKNI